MKDRKKVNNTTEDKKFRTLGDVKGIEYELKHPGMFQEVFSRINERISEIYGPKYTDPVLLQGLRPWLDKPYFAMETLDELLKRDKQREKDGFPKKIKVGKLIKPSKDGDKVEIVPTIDEEKFLHGMFSPEGEGGDGTGGQGEGEEGEVVGEQPIEGEGEGEEGDEGAGKGGGGEHGIEKDAWEMGKWLTEQFELPNIQDKGKKVPVDKYDYTLSDVNRGSGQVLDIKRSLRQIIKTNVGLGKIDKDNIDTTKLLVAPRDKWYRILSRERVYESMCVVFLARDYSGSMSGKPTEVVVTQQIMIYCWLMYQYKNMVWPRFILHDAEAEEVLDFNTYVKSVVAGGTKVASAYRLINKIVDEENLARDYNIYVLHGTDGEDWDREGRETIPEIEKILTYVNRMGITVARNAWGGSKATSEVEEYVKKSGLLDTHKELLRLDAMNANEANEARIIDGIKALLKE